MSDFFKRKNKYDFKTIGVVDLCDQAGATELSIMLGNYLANGLHRKIALINISNDKSFELLKDRIKVSKPVFYKGKLCNKGFSYKGIDFYCGVREEIIGVLKEHYDYVIINSGVLDAKDNFLNNMKPILNCDKKIFVGSLLIWKVEECLKKIERIDRLIKVRGLFFVTYTYDKIVASQLNREYGLSPFVMKMEINPFCMKGTNLKWISYLLER